MIYINQNNNILEKYEVIFDKNKIENLLMKVIKRCSEKHKIKEERIYIPNNGPGYQVVLDYNKENIVYIENVTATKTGKTMTLYEDYYPYETDIYNCQYLKYIAPNFAGFISELIYNPNSIIPYLFNQDFTTIKHFPTVEEKINKLNLEITKLKTEYTNTINNNIEIKTKNYDELIQLKELLSNNNTSKIIKEKEIELTQLLELNKLNKDQEPITEYLEELKSLVNFKLIDTINLSEIDKINSFFEEKIINIKTKKLTK